MGLWDHNKPYNDPLKKYKPDNILSILDEFSKKSKQIVELITGKEMNISEKLDFYAKNNFNVILVGEHGCGKTALVNSCFQPLFGNNWLYFSAATMDPWVDFIGIPREAEADGVKYLDLIRPKMFAEDKVEAIFLDEFNRANKKVRNAAMELIQFKSINGKKFKNLKIVWAAINPFDEEDTYDVERLDPAQEDRFHVKINIEKKPDYKYFSNKFGPDNASAAIEWWKQLYKTNAKLAPSPRRLDYALELFNIGGDINDVLDKATNPKSLLNILNEGTIEKQIEKIASYTDEKLKRNSLKKLFNDSNKYDRTIDFLISEKNKSILLSLLPFIDGETISRIVNESKDNLNNKFIECLLQDSSPTSTSLLNWISENKLGNDLIKKKVLDAVSLQKKSQQEAVSLRLTYSGPPGSTNDFAKYDNQSYYNLSLMRTESIWEKETFCTSVQNVINTFGFKEDSPNIVIVYILNKLFNIACGTFSENWNHKYDSIPYSINTILKILSTQNRFETVISKTVLTHVGNLSMVNARLAKLKLDKINLTPVV